MIRKLLNNERGLAMLIMLAILLMLGLLGVAVIRTSSTDMSISEAMTDRTRAFYAAEGGLELALGTMTQHASMVNRDSLLHLINADTVIGEGCFRVSMTNTYPIRTVTSLGRDQEGEACVAADVRHRRSPLNVWNNAIFAGVGQTGRGIAGNVDIHGSVHILGEGEPFTDQNGNDQWDDRDLFTDLNGNGTWQAGEPLTTDHDGDGTWDAAEPYVDDNGNGAYDETLTATDLSFEATGTAAVGNNYNGMPVTVSSRVPALSAVPFNGENVISLDAEMRVKHGRVNLSGTAHIGQTDASGGTPAIKETMDGIYVNDGYGGNAGTANVYADNGTSEAYDLPDGAIGFPSLNDSSNGYANHKAYLAANALVISGDIVLTPGVAYTSPASPYGSLHIDASGNMTISGIVMVTGNVTISPGSGALKNTPVQYDGRGTLVAQGSMYVNTSVLSKDAFPTNDVAGFLSYHNLELATGSGASQLTIMGAFFAQNQIINQKQNNIAGAMVSNYFSMTNVPSIWQVPALVDNLPPGMPGGATIVRYVWKELPSTWREVSAS
jgi:hypothetical protein